MNSAQHTYDGEYIICPHCGERMGDCNEWVHGDATENVCSYCDRAIIVWAEYDVTYHAMPAAKSKDSPDATA